MRRSTYNDLGYKADYMRIIPEAWVKPIKLDTQLDYENCGSTKLLLKIEDYIRLYPGTSKDLCAVDAPSRLGLVADEKKPDEN